MALSRIQFASFLSVVICHMAYFVCYIGISITMKSMTYYFIPFAFMMISLLFHAGIFVLQAKYHKWALMFPSFFVSIAKILLYLLWFYYVDYPFLSSFFSNGNAFVQDMSLSIFVMAFGFFVLLSFVLENLTITLYFMKTKHHFKEPGTV